MFLLYILFENRYNKHQQYYMAKKLINQTNLEKVKAEILLETKKILILLKIVAKLALSKPKA